MTGQNKQTISNLASRPSFLGVEHEDFVPPTSDEVKELRKMLGFTQVDLAKFVGVSWNKRISSAVQKWETFSSKESRQINASAWQLMLIKAGYVEISPLFEIKRG